MRKNKKFIDPRYFMDEKMELNEGDEFDVDCTSEMLPGEDEWDRSARLNYCSEQGIEITDPSAEEAKPTNMNRNLREFAQWVADVDGHVERLSGDSVRADEIPSDMNLYDIWLLGLSPDQAAADLLSRDH